MSMNQTALAKIFWDNIPDSIQIRLLNNFWCGSSCRNLTGVAVETMSIEKGDLIIRGKCIQCGAKIARLIEGDNELRKRSVKIRPSEVDASSNPDISKLVKFREGTKQDLQLGEVKKLKIKLFREWNPEEELFQDEEDQGSLPHPFDNILAAGLRPMWEMENILPGHNPEDFDCPISQGIEILNSGDWDGAVRHMQGLLTKDARCLDAYAHLGNWYFEYDDLNKAKNFYKMGVAIGIKSIHKKINDVFSWSLIDNRPFLRCLHGLGLVYYRQRRPVDALPIFTKMLWLNPSDNQGVRFLINSIVSGILWEDCGAT